MLSVKTYPIKYINSCKKRVRDNIETFKKTQSVPETLKTLFFNNMVLILDYMFVHRMRGQEGKDGNPLNEVRMICNSILTNNNKLLADKPIKYNAEKSVLKIGLGQVISLSSKDFIKLSNAYFEEIEKKFS